MQNNKILYCASTTEHIINFHTPYITALAHMGYEVTVCANRQEAIADTKAFFVVPFTKNITSVENIKNIFRVFRYLKQHSFTAISVHTTLAAAVVRAAVRLLPAPKRPKVFYTCHGYLFSENDGLGKIKYLLPEIICAGITDVLLVMNREDKEIAERYGLYKRNGCLKMIPGMGVDFSRFDILQNKPQLRYKYGIRDTEVLFVSVGEFSDRKNRQMLIDVFVRSFDSMPDAKLILAGDGELLDDCKEQVEKLHAEKRIIFAGHVSNMPELYHLSDISLSSSRKEGLPFNIMEAMYCNVPCIATDIKGHRDLIENGKTGFLFQNETELFNQMLQLYNDAQLRETIAQNAKKSVLLYNLKDVQPIVMQVYDENL
ncbi:MAG: glycosyltransferase [Peptococcaceae bacterium]|nr:glycosyltransferase [Peptococcaceae bacterium]